MVRSVILALAGCLLSAGAAAQHLTLDRIFHKPYISGSRPGAASLSPDGAQLLFQWDSTATDEKRLWSVLTKGGTARQVLDSAVSSYAWSPDGKRVAYVQKGDVFITDPAFTKAMRLTKTPAGEGQLTWSDDGRYLSVTTRNIMVLPVDGPGFYQLTDNTNESVSYAVIGFSPDAKRVLFVEYNQSGLPEFLVPDFLNSDVTTRKTRRGFSKIRVGIAPVDTGATLWLHTTPERFLIKTLQYSPDGKRVLLDQFSTDRKHRRISVFDADSGKSRTLYTEHDSTWMEEGTHASRWSRSGASVYFTSERDGWNHLYKMGKDSTELQQLTHGEWEVDWFGESISGTVYFTANKEEKAQWHLYTLDNSSGAARRLTRRSGSHFSPTLARNADVIVYSYADFDSPTDLHSINRGKETQLTNSIPQEFQSHKWIKPEIMQFTARDGRQVHAMLYKPGKLDLTKRYPVVVFVHGAGYLQNVVRSWTGYYREYMFNNYLVNKGYIVFEVDYRGSAGYGREFRRDVYMHLGGKDLYDELDGVEYLKNLGYIDSTRIGMYGGSYGGFLPLMGLFTSPHTFACAAVLRAVTSWENYYRHNPWYTGARLGNPDSNKSAYEKSSPITFADSLTKPLLILHGMVDDNVFFQDAVQLVHKLQKAGKKFELMMYPAEAHTFTRPESWHDEYRRIDEFFDRHLLVKQ